MVLAAPSCTDARAPLAKMFPIISWLVGPERQDAKIVRTLARLSPFWGTALHTRVAGSAGVGLPQMDDVVCRTCLVAREAGLRDEQADSFRQPSAIPN